jgi:hypothetical protein
LRFRRDRFEPAREYTLPLDRSSITRWRNRMGEENLAALLQESLAVATRTGAMKPSDLNRVIVDTTVQPKNITFPTDAKLMNRAREKLVNLANRLGVKLRQSYKRVGKLALIMHQRYAHARQFKRANSETSCSQRADYPNCSESPRGIARSRASYRVCLALSKLAELCDPRLTAAAT